jgi:hypothetical protein
LKPKPRALQCSGNRTPRGSNSLKPTEIEIMAPSIPTCRPTVTPSRIALTLAGAALAANLYLVLGDAMAHDGATAPAASVTTACADAAYTRHPGTLDLAAVALGARVQ